MSKRRTARPRAAVGSQVVSASSRAGEVDGCSLSDTRCLGMEVGVTTPDTSAILATGRPLWELAFNSRVWRAG
jgi:hypothetical protein